MHTTFIPVLFCIVVILFGWFAKAFLIPVKWFFGKGQEHKNPLRLTVAFCGLLFTMFTLFSYVVSTVEEKIEKKSQIQVSSEQTQ